MSPDPPKNHKGTAARAPGRKAPALASASQPEALAVGAFFDAMAGRSDRWLLTAAQRKRLAPAVAAALGENAAEARMSGDGNQAPAGAQHPAGFGEHGLRPARP